jgi:hypothetical protein
MDVREAARRTLRAGSARVAMHWFLEPPVSNRLIAAMQQRVEGVADLSRRRARLSTLPNPELDALADRIASRWPWLDDADDEGEGEGEGADRSEWVTVMIGGHRYVGTGQRWTLADPDCALDNPAWVLDALGGARGASPAGAEDVRGVACDRYRLEPPVDLSAAARAANGALELPPHGDVERPTLHGDVWVDADGLVRRVTWSQPPRGRRRLRPRAVPHRRWHTVELWDFGLEVAIDVPHAEPMPESGPFVRDLWQLGGELWRMRSGYRRASAASRRS